MWQGCRGCRPGEPRRGGAAMRTHYPRQWVGGRGPCRVGTAAWCRGEGQCRAGRWFGRLCWGFGLQLLWTRDCELGCPHGPLGGVCELMSGHLPRVRCVGRLWGEVLHRLLCTIQSPCPPRNSSQACGRPARPLQCLGMEPQLNGTQAGPLPCCTALVWVWDVSECCKALTNLGEP